MGTYIRVVGFIVACFLLGLAALAALPVLAIMGLGALFMFLIYALVQVSKINIDDEIKDLKEKRNR